MEKNRGVIQNKITERKTAQGKTLIPFDNVSKIYNERLVSKTIERKGVLYYNTPAAFDIETTSFVEDERCLGTMYIWMVGIGQTIFYGRTWDEFDIFLDSVRALFGLTEKRRLIFFVHNLAFEFQFIQFRFQWSEVFSIKPRRPVKCHDVTGIEFRCAYILSGMGLANLAENLKSGIRKLKGDLDYSLIRHCETPITDKELDYCYNDIDILLQYIREKIEKDGGVTNILLTKTSYVRQYCRNQCHSGGKHSYLSYRKLMNKLTMDAKEYAACSRAFTGGFTHCSHDKSMKIIKDVVSYDITSSYPTVMVSELFPMSHSWHKETVTWEEFLEIKDTYCCIFDLHVKGVNPIKDFEHPISASKCWRIDKRALLDNGRVVSADYLSTTLTNIDFDIFSEYYEYSEIEITNIYYYRKAYLPRAIIESVLHFYENKTKLKGVKDQEFYYNLNKEFLNSIYGMAVTDPVRDEIVFNEGWQDIIKADVVSSIEKHNNNNNRFLFYPWGVFVTAYARKNLFSLISECGYDHVYCDTDSDKFINHEKHIKFINSYNAKIMKKIQQCITHYNLNPELACPLNKPLGGWELDNTYSYFKSLGAKRYIGITNGELSCTVAGCDKNAMVAYLLGLKDSSKEYVNQFNYNVHSNILNKFKDGLIIPASLSNKMLIRYDDEESHGVIKDYLGNTAEYHEKSSAYLGNTTFELTVLEKYLEYINIENYQDESEELAIIDNYAFE